ncbi:hypothetical protein CDL15_Pgr022626 [Punica granatum]|uniref:Uncharacterized protein n=1 Tax=Punica granatum TaxID=22663 RepID=A0A218XQQ8_PUNGR|nr:hypothetical protein CDL15_Pgr022626 [Punica granatum]
MRIPELALQICLGLELFGDSRVRGIRAFPPVWRPRENREEGGDWPRIGMSTAGYSLNVMDDLFGYLLVGFLWAPFTTVLLRGLCGFVD